MGNLSNREQEIRQTKLNIIDLETNLEYTTKKLKKKPDDVHLLAHSNLLKGLLKKQKNTLQQLELLGVTERISKTMPYDDHLAEDFDDILNTISKKTGSLNLNDNNDENPGNMPLEERFEQLQDEDQKELDEMLEMLSGPKSVVMPDVPTRVYTNIETRIKAVGDVESRLDDIEELCVSSELEMPKLKTKKYVGY